jgi:hypothetical protein
MKRGMRCCTRGQSPHRLVSIGLEGRCTLLVQRYQAPPAYTIDRQSELASCMSPRLWDRTFPQSGSGIASLVLVTAAVNSKHRRDAYLYRESRLTHTTVTQNHQLVQCHLARHDEDCNLELRTAAGMKGSRARISVLRRSDNQRELCVVQNGPAMARCTDRRAADLESRLENTEKAISRPAWIEAERLILVYRRDGA